MTKKQIEAQEIADAIQALKNFGCENGATIYTTTRSVAKSGTSRAISFFIISTEADGSNYIQGVDYLVGVALGLKRHKDGGYVVRGCGMDMGYKTVSDLASVMEYALKQRWI